MGKKFDAVYESVVQRSEIGGFLPGDIIKFRDGYKNTETYKFMPSTLKKEVDELATCGLNIKVCQVGDKQSGYSIGNQFKPASQIVLTIAADHGGGRTYGRVVVCPDMVDMVDVSAGVPVPDQFKRKDTVIIKPKQLKIDPNIITNVTDKGNGKNTPTDLKLAGESKAWDCTKELADIYMESLGEVPLRNMSPEKSLGEVPRRDPNAQPSTKNRLNLLHERLPELKKAIEDVRYGSFKEFYNKISEFKDFLDNEFV